MKKTAMLAGGAYLAYKGTISNYNQDYSRGFQPFTIKGSRTDTFLTHSA